jgi:predicted nucleotidyltransferase
MMSADVYTLKTNIEKSKRARDFLMAHDQLQEVGTSEFEYSMKQDIPAFLKYVVNDKGSTDLGSLKRLMGVWSFKKYYDCLGFLSQEFEKVNYELTENNKEIVSTVGEKLFNTGLKLHSLFDV